MGGDPDNQKRCAEKLQAYADGKLWGAAGSDVVVGNGRQMLLFQVQAKSMNSAGKVDKLYTTGELSEILGVSRRTVSRLVASGQLVGIRLNVGGGAYGQIRVSATELERYLREARSA